MNLADSSIAGIIPRMMSRLFEDKEKHGMKLDEVRVSFLEIYNEKIRDLLASHVFSREADNKDKRGHNDNRTMSNDATAKKSRGMHSAEF